MSTSFLTLTIAFNALPDKRQNGVFLIMSNQGNIFLTGFMGSGKSSMGKKLALLMRRDYVDLDKFIEKRTASSIQQIFEHQGEEIFRRLEQQCLHELLQKQVKSVIALGGGTVCFFDNLQQIKINGLLIYLQLPPKVLADRIRKSKNKRPLLHHLKSDELQKTIIEKLQGRQSYYGQSHLTVNGLNLTAQILQHNIIEYQKAHSS